MSRQFKSRVYRAKPSLAALSDTAEDLKTEDSDLQLGKNSPTAARGTVTHALFNGPTEQRRTSVPYVFTANTNHLCNKGRSPKVPHPQKKKNKMAKSLENLVTQVKQTTIHSETLYKEHLFQTFQSMKFVKGLPMLPESFIESKALELPRRPGYESKKTVIFDLDETLVHCVNDPDAPCDVTLDIKFPSGATMQAGVNIRPFARECLIAANVDFEVIVFTASHKCYADVVLDYLDPHRTLIHHRLYREHCIQVQGILMKDLRVLRHRKLKDIVIVDNAAYSFGYQVENGVPIISWHENYSDRELYNLMDYLKVLAEANDIREVNKETFHLKTFYEDYLNEVLQREKKSTEKLHNKYIPRHLAK